jgi:PleD family two-component response regulator
LSFLVIERCYPACAIIHRSNLFALLANITYKYSHVGLVLLCRLPDAAAAQGKVMVTNTSPVVLVIDDDRDLAKLVEMLLQKINVKSVLMFNGIAALDWLSQPERLDMVILDMMLPDMDGLEVLRRIRSHPELDGVPILVLSAKADPNTIRYSLDNGADGYITKPYLSNSLIARVQTLLDSGRTV